MSPRGGTFNKGERPYQRFIEIKEYRDSLVRLSSQKIEGFRAISFEIAKKAALTATEIIERISEFLAPSKQRVSYPFWLTRLGPDDLFSPSREIELKLHAAYPIKGMEPISSSFAPDGAPGD